MYGHLSRGRGFTIVELLIVIVVIGIIAAIVISVYGNMQQRTRDTRRASDMTLIRKALLLYQTQNGGVPRTFAYSGADGGGWDSSATAPWMSFLTAEYGGPAPVDPINTPNVVGTGDPTQGGQSYFYYCYNAGSGPNPATANVRTGYWSERTGTRVNVDIPVDSCL
jgi:prepilin-type N-terminal cleavage/methylation domain-containing protein